MGIQFGMCQQCTQYKGIISIPCCDFLKENNKPKIIEPSFRIKQESIILPNGNNMNSYYESKVNQNNNNFEEEDGFNLSLSPISKEKKNNFNFYQMNNINDSTNNKYNSSNIESNNKVNE